MGVTDPRKLAVILHDLEDEIERWSTIASSMLQATRYAQNLAREQTDISHRRARLLTEEFYETESIQRARNAITIDLNQKSQDGVDSATQLLKDADQKLNQARAVLAHWTEEFAKAQAWLIKAQDRLHRAEAELAAAERKLSMAERELSSARADLDNCRNTRREIRNSQGQVVRVERPDCSGREAAVRQAQRAVESAREQVNEARSEVNRALAETNRAKARVQACTQAVRFAENAMEHSNLCVERSNQSNSEVLRSLDYAKSAQSSVDRAGDMVEDSRLTVTDMNNMIQKADDHLRTAQEFLFKGANAEESAQRYRILARAELQYRVEMLYALNVPELGSINVSSVIPTVGGLSAAAQSSGFAAASPKRPRRESSDPTLKGNWYTVETIISIDDLPPIDEPDDETRKIIPIDTLRQTIQRIDKMMPQLHEGIGEHVEFWQALDSTEGTVGPASYQATYETYRGKDPVVVVQLDDGTYWVKSGKIRVWLAQQEKIDAIPVCLMKRPDYLYPRHMTDASGQNWKLCVYESPDGFKIRAYNVSVRYALPESITDGDGVIMDAMVEQDEQSMLVIERFDYTSDDEQMGLHVQALEWAEDICKNKHYEICALRLSSDRVANPKNREWYQSRGYTINREGEQVLIYKRPLKG